MLIYSKSSGIAKHLPKFRETCLRAFCSKYSDDIEKVRRRNQEALQEPSGSKAFRIVKDDFNRWKKGIFKPEEPKVPKQVEYLVVGGGIMGSAIAYWMKQRAPDSFDLLVAERDPKYTRASTTLSVGGIRQQFSLPENINLSLYSAHFLRNIKQHLSVLDDDPPDIQFQPHGYLFLASEAGVEQMIENNKIQIECGAKVELLRPKQLQEKFPWLNVEGIALGSFGVENEGWFDPWCLLSAFKKKAYSLGAKYMNGEVIGFEFEHIPYSVRGSHEIPDTETHVAYIKDEEGEVHTVEFHVLIVAAGAYSAEVARMLTIGKGPGILQVPLPVEPRKRYVYTFHCNDGPSLDMPLLIDPTGAYVRREGLGGCYICGRSPTPEEEPDTKNLDVDYNFFDDKVWPVIANRIPAFNCIKVSGAWAGYYDYNTIDQNALFGFHPFFTNVFFVTGFSGHGIQMAPAVGRAVTEAILDKELRTETLDLTRFGLYRIFDNYPLYEKNIV